MGTNIYLVKKANSVIITETKEQFNKALQTLEDTGNITEATETLITYLQGLQDEIHICKRSCGWQLLFRSHKELYDCTWQTMSAYIKKVLDEGTYVMEDEYGQPYTLDDLKKDLETSRDGLTGAQYDEQMRAKGARVYNSAADFEYISDGLRWTDKDFC